MTAHHRALPTSAPGLLRAYALCALALLCALVWLGTALAHLDAPWMSGGMGVVWGGKQVLLGCALALTGAFLVARRTMRPFGQLLLVSGSALNAGEALCLAAGAAGVPPRPFTVLYGCAMLARVPYNTAITTLPLWVPDGRLPRTWGRWAVAAAALAAVLVVAHDTVLGLPSYYGGANLMAPWGRSGPLAPLGPGRRPLWQGAATALMAASLAVMAVRWRLSRERHPGLAALLAPYLLWVLVVFSVPQLPLSDTAVEVLLYGCTAVWPLAVGHAFAKNRTWYLDRTDRRTLTAFLLTYGVVTVYGGLMAALVLLAPDVLTAEALAMAALSLAVGVLLRPTARWAGRVVEHYYYGERAQPYHVVRDLVERLGRAVEPGDAPRLLCATVVRTLGLPGARLSVRTRTGPRELASLGDLGGLCEGYPLVYQGEVVGDLAVCPRPGEHCLDRQDREAVRELAGHAAPAIASLRLYQDLQSSREQIVLAREEERRRLRDDLHDGVGPTLSALRLQADVVRASLPADGAGARAMRAVSQGIGEVVEELRHITDGLAPAALSGAGLTAALRELGGRMSGPSLAVHLAFRPDPLPPLPAAVEVAAYRIASEALNNVVRHAGAARARLEVCCEGGAVRVEVRDDGSGFPVHRGSRGVGLRSMAERAAELGGGLTVSSDSGGTAVRAVLPSARGTAAPA